MLETRKHLVGNTALANPAPPGERIALIALCLGYFMVILDSTIVNVVAPVLHTELGATHSAVQWAIDGYLLAFASVLLTAGGLGDRLSNKSVFLTGLVAFTTASVGCGFAPTIAWLIAARMVQGVGAALLVPPSLALLNHTFTTPDARARAIGVWAGVAGIGAAAGPVVGGVLINWLGWRSVFLVNLPVGIVGFGLTWRFVRRSPGLRQRGIDLPAQLAAILALGMLVFAFNQGHEIGWGNWPIWGALIVSLIAVLGFVRIERRAVSPMLPLTLFSSSTFSAANIVGLLTNLGFYGQLFFINLFFQQIKGYTPLRSGLALLPETTMVWLAAWLSGRITARRGARLPMVLGPLIGAAGFLAMLAVDTGTPYWITAIALMAIGFGMAFNMPAMTTACIAAVPVERSSIASGVLNAARQSGSSLGVALLGSLAAGQAQSMVSGMHVALVVAGAVFLVAAAVSFFAVRNGTRPSVMTPVTSAERGAGTTGSGPDRIPYRRAG